MMGLRMVNTWQILSVMVLATTGCIVAERSQEQRWSFEDASPGVPFERPPRL